MEGSKKVFVFVKAAPKKVGRIGPRLTLVHFFLYQIPLNAWRSGLKDPAYQIIVFELFM